VDGSTRYASASFERVTEEQNDVLSGEGCVIFTDDEEPPFTAPGDLIDAGPKITIFAEGQPYAVLEKVDQGFGDVFYQTGGDALFSSLPPIPEARLSVTIPGASFPAFDDVTMPPLPPAFTLDNIADLTPLTLESRLVWTPSTPAADDVRSLVGFTAVQVKNDGSFIHLQCFIADDGDFTFTGEVRTILSEKGFSDGHFTQFARYFERAEVKETNEFAAGLLLSTSVVSDPLYNEDKTP